MAVEKTTVARPYAEAIFALAEDSKKLDLWSEMLAFLAEVAKDSQLADAFTNPNVDLHTLTELMLEIGTGQLNEQGQNLVRLLAVNRRLELLPEIQGLFEALKDESEGALEVHVSAPYALKPAQEQLLADALHERLGREIRISSEEDPKLIGGALIRAGDLVIDGSVQGKLHQLATELGI